MDADEIRKGIAGYDREQTIILRLLRKLGAFSETQFDRWLKFREYRRPRFYPRAITGDTFILGMGVNGGNQWATWLELMQMMIRLGLIETYTEDGRIWYRLSSLQKGTSRG